MKTVIRCLCLVSLASLYASIAAAADSGPSATAPASDPAFRLHLAAALEPGDLEAEPATDPAAPVVKPVQIAALQAFNDPNAWRSTHAADASLQQNQSGGGGFGRWLKKRWYIPVIAAAVIGVTLADDDDSGETDDD